MGERGGPIAAIDQIGPVAGFGRVLLGASSAALALTIATAAIAVADGDLFMILLVPAVLARL